MNPRAHASAAGFSLFELVMVIVLLTIVAAVAAPFASNGFKAYYTGRDLAETDWQARVALERMTRDLRSVRAPADITMTSGADLSIIDVDGTTIRYCLGTIGTCPGASGELMRNTQPLATGVSGLVFSYLTRANPPVTTAVPANVYYIVVDFTATQGSNSRPYQATVSPRTFP